MLMVASSGGSAAAVAAIKDGASRPVPDHQRADCRAHADAGLYLLQADLGGALDDHAALRFLLITVLLTVSVNQRLAEIAALRALGFSRRRAAADVFVQGALLVGVGGVLAVPLGMALSIWLDRILKAMPGIPAAMHFFVFEPRTLVTACRPALCDHAACVGLSDVARRAIADRGHAAQRGGRMNDAARRRARAQQGLPDGRRPGALRCATSRVQIPAGEYLAIRGPSGCGKSTLLHILGCVDTPISGALLFDGREVAALPDVAAATCAFGASASCSSASSCCRC